MGDFLRYGVLAPVLGVLPMQSLWSQVVIAHPGVQSDFLSQTFLFSLFSLRYLAIPVMLGGGTTVVMLVGSLMHDVVLSPLVQDIPDSRASERQWSWPLRGYGFFVVVSVL